MQRIYQILFISLGLLVAGNVQAQTTSATTPDTLGIVLHADPRIDAALQHHKDIIIGSRYMGRGYRVQIYSGNDRSKAIRTKIDFIRRFPDIPTYMTYVSPQFRIKVGNFRTRAEAHELYKKVSELYNPCMIVPDIVVINTIKDDQ